MIKFKVNDSMIIKNTVNSKPRKLKAKWTLELQNELENIYFDKNLLNKMYMEELEKNPFIKEEEFKV